MQRKLTLLAILGLLSGLLVIPAVSSAPSWAPGDGNPAARAQELGNGEFANNIFGDDWPPFQNQWPFSGDMPGNGQGPPVDDGDDDGSDDNDSQDPATQCQEDIEAAQAADDGRACTEQFARMQCPHDAEVTHGAANGCQISELQDRGWTSIPIDDGNDTDEDTGDDNQTPPDEDEDADEEPDDGDGTEVTEERHVTPAPEPEYVADTWISYPNPRDHVLDYSTINDYGDIQICKVLLNQAGEVITGETVPDTTFSVDTDIVEGVPQYTDSDPVTFTTPLDHYNDLVGSSPDYVEGDGMLDAECAEYHNVPFGTYHYDMEEITGANADQVEFVGVTEYWDDANRGNPFGGELFDYGQNDLSDGIVTLTPDEDENHAEVIFVNQLK